MSKIDQLDANFAARPVRDGLAWTDALDLGLEGRGYEDTELPYDRLPRDAEQKVSGAVWSLQRLSAGIAVRFRTASPQIGVRWTVLNRELGMDHMPATGVSGVDLYGDAGGGYRYVGTGRPSEYPSNSATFAGSQDGHTWSFLLNLPLYNGTRELEIGVPPEHALELDTTHPAAGRPPVCFYGTSVTQGGCASRPGMAYPAILGRLLGVRTINLGFSGNGKSEPEVAEILARLDPLVYVLDPLANMELSTVPGRIDNLLRVLRRARPATPIVVVEHARPSRLTWPTDWRAINREAGTVVEALRRGGFADLHVVGWETLMGVDNEATVDGVHPSDLGFTRIAAGIAPVLGPLVATRGREAAQPRG